MMNVTHMDVKKLIDEPSGQVRSLLAAKIARDYRGGGYSDAEAGIAADIFRLLLKDIEKIVRAALARELAHCDNLPHDIVMKMATDDTEVASHVLEYSFVLTEDDLVSIIRSTREVVKLSAIARRKQVSERIAGELIESRQAIVLHDLFANSGAVLGADDVLKSWEFISGDAPLLETLVRHGNLPLQVAEKLFYVVSEELRTHLSRRYKLNGPVVHKVVSGVREMQMLGVIPAQKTGSPANDEQVEMLVDELFKSERLTHSFLMRALCTGNMGVFEAGIARLAGLPRVNARILMMDGGRLGFDAVYETAGLPEGFREAIRVLLQISLEETEYGRMQRADFRKRVIDRIYIGKYNLTVENMEYLLAIIGGRVAAVASVH